MWAELTNISDWDEGLKTIFLLFVIVYKALGAYVIFGRGMRPATRFELLL